GGAALDGFGGRMKNRGTIGLLVAALAAAGFYFWFEREHPGTQAAALEDRKLLPPTANRGKPAAIDRIEIARPNEKLVLALDNGRVWRLLTPLADRANPKTVRELVEALETSLKFDSIPANPEVLERAGLRAPEARLKIFRGNEAPVELELGAPTAV